MPTKTLSKMRRMVAKNTTKKRKRRMVAKTADKKKRAAMVPRPPTATSFGADLIEDLKQVLEHQRGKIELEQVWPKPVDVKAIRQQTKLSQAEFSRAFGISKRALQEWEQGGRRPDATARAYLTVISKEPALVRRALATE